MDWYALCDDGEIRPLGTHEDFDGAETMANRLKLCTVWIYDRHALLEVYANLRTVLWSGVNWERH